MVFGEDNAYEWDPSRDPDRRGANQPKYEKSTFDKAAVEYMGIMSDLTHKVLIPLCKRREGFNRDELGKVLQRLDNASLDYDLKAVPRSLEDAYATLTEFVRRLSAIGSTEVITRYQQILESQTDLLSVCHIYAHSTHGGIKPRPTTCKKVIELAETIADRHGALSEDALAEAAKARAYFGKGRVHCVRCPFRERDWFMGALPGN